MNGSTVDAARSTKTQGVLSPPDRIARGGREPKSRVCGEHHSYLSGPKEAIEAPST